MLSACSAGQQSYETDESEMGLFLTTFYDKLAAATNDKKPSKTTKALEGIIARPTDSFPLERIVESVNKGMVAELKGLKLEQVCKLYGKEKPEGAEYDAKEPLAAAPTLPPLVDSPINKKSLALVKDVLEEIGVPAVKVTREDNGLRFDMLPPFQEEQMAKLGAAPAPEDPKVRTAVGKARVVLWAIAADTGSLSGPFAKEVAKVKADVGANLSVLRNGYLAPGPGNAETAFKNMVLKDEREVAKILGTLNDTLEMLKEAEEARENESKRWQANYDFMTARVKAQLAYLTEYQSMLGSMRKEFPDRGDINVNKGWRLASQTELNGDTTGKKLAKESQKTLEKLAKDYPGTPWEVLAKREKLTALGLDWKPSQVIGR